MDFGSGFPSGSWPRIRASLGIDALLAGKHKLNDTITQDARSNEVHPWSVQLTSTRQAYQYAASYGVGLYDSGLGLIWHYNPDTGAFYIRGAEAWTAANFSPGSKHPVNSTLYQNAKSGEVWPWQTEYADGKIIGMVVNSTVTALYDNAQGYVWEYHQDTKEFKIKGGVPWTTVNFNPNDKANLTGAAFTGDVSTSGSLFASAAVGTLATANRGGLLIRSPNSGDPHSGYFEFYRPNVGQRDGYFGYSDGVSITVAAEVAYYNFVGLEPRIGNNKIYHAGNLNPIRKYVQWIQGDGVNTLFFVTHNLNTQDFTFSVTDINGGSTLCDVYPNNANQAIVRFGTPIAASETRKVVIIG